MLENFSLDEGGDATVDTGHDDAEDFWSRVRVVRSNLINFPRETS